MKTINVYVLKEFNYDSEEYEDVGVFPCTKYKEEWSYHPMTFTGPFKLELPVQVQSDY